MLRANTYDWELLTSDIPDPPRLARPSPARASCCGLVGSQTPPSARASPAILVARARAQRAIAGPLRLLGGLVAALASALGEVVRGSPGRRRP